MDVPRVRCKEPETRGLRGMNRDTLTGIVGALILVTAMVGVFWYERNTALAAQADTSALQEVVLVGPGLSGSTPVGDSSTDTITLAQNGLTNVTFVLKWTAGAGSDTMRLVVAPSAETGMAEGLESSPSDTGEITLTFPVANTATDGAAGVGPWQVTVEFVSASTGTAIPPGTVPMTSDTSVAWTIETSLQHLALPTP